MCNAYIVVDLLNHPKICIISLPSPYLVPLVLFPFRPGTYSNYDSGSPIIIPSSSSSSRDVLVGLVSWGEWCADPFFPGVNSRVSDASDWIDEIVCALSADPPSDFCPFSWYGTWKRHKRIITGGLLAACIVLGIVLQAMRRRNNKNKMLPEIKPSYSQATTYESIESVEVTP